MKMILAAVVMVLVVTGCATQTYYLNKDNQSELRDQKMQHFFVGGIAQEKEVNAAQVCGGTNKVMKVESHQRFVDGLLSVVTLGIYTPRTAKVYCSR